MQFALVVVLIASANCFSLPPDQTGSSNAVIEAPADLRPAETRMNASLSSPAPSTNILAATMPHKTSTETPTQAMTHRFFDRENLIGFAVHGAVRIADSTQSCMLLGKSGRQESWLPTKTCSSITAYSLSMVATQILGSYGLHRSGYHMLERWLPYAWAAPSAAGIAVSIKAW